MTTTAQRIATGLATLCAITLATPALAQLQEITVTAQKREQNLNDVAGSIEAFSGAQLEAMRIDDIIDVTGLTAGLDITNTLGGDNPRVALRGVGLNDFNANNNPTIGVYVDEVFAVSPATIGFMLFDIDRIEILKGPQGTLYGRNSNGGAINIHTVQPSEEFNGYGSIGFGDYDTLEFEGAIGGSLSDSVQGRVSVRYQDQGETFEFDENTGDSFGGSETWGVRSQLQVGTDSFEGRLKVEFSSSDTAHIGFKEDPIGNLDGTFGADGFSIVRCPAAMTGHGNRTECGDFSQVFAPGLTPPLLLFTDKTDDPFGREAPTGASRPLRGDNDTFSVNLNLSWDLANEMTLTSVTGFDTMERYFSEGAINAFEAIGIYHNEEIDAVSQEIRLNGNTERANWVVGAFYSADEVFTDNVMGLADTYLTEFGYGVDQDTTAFAVFASADWNLSESVRLTTGLRYTDEERDFVGGTTDLNPFDSSCVIDPLCGPTGLGAIPLSFMDRTISKDDISYRVGLDYKPSEGLMFYGNISSGFKSGGFFGDLTFSSAELEPFEPEDLTAYEVGFKATLADNRVQWNGAAFYYDYQDIQTLVPTAIALAFTNAEKGEITGFETELQWSPTDNLDIRMAASFLDAELGAFGVIPAGNKMPNAPDTSYTGLIRYEVPFSNGTAFAAQADFKFSDDMYRDAFNDPLLFSPSYTVYNASLTLFDQDGDWSVSLWGRNLGDEVYRTQALAVEFLGLAGVLYGAPRTYGISLRRDF